MGIRKSYTRDGRYTGKNIQKKLNMIGRNQQAINSTFPQQQKFPDLNRPNSADECKQKLINPHPTTKLNREIGIGDYETCAFPLVEFP